MSHEPATQKSRNRAIAETFERLADLLEINGATPFTCESHRAAGRAIRDQLLPLSSFVERGEKLTRIPYVHDDHARTIREILETGTCRKLRSLCLVYPDGLAELLRLPGMTPRTVRWLYHTHGITSPNDLSRSLRSGTLRELEGMNAETARMLRWALPRNAASGDQACARTVARDKEDLAALLDQLESVKAWMVAQRETGQPERLHVLVETDDPRRTTAELLGTADASIITRMEDGHLTLSLGSDLVVAFRLVEVAASP